MTGIEIEDKLSSSRCSKYSIWPHNRKGLRFDLHPSAPLVKSCKELLCFLSRRAAQHLSCLDLVLLVQWNSAIMKKCLAARHRDAKARGSPIPMHLFVYSSLFCEYCWLPISVMGHYWVLLWDSVQKLMNILQMVRVGLYFDVFFLRSNFLRWTKGKSIESRLASMEILT